MARTILFQKLKRIFYKAYCQNIQSAGVSKASKYKRRRLLKLGILAGGSTVATTTFPWLKTAWSKYQPNIAIIGGGLAGLNAAYQLKKVGLIATVYEAKSRVGGRVHSVTGVAEKDLVSDLGGLFINSGHEDILALVEEFNLSLFNRIAHGEKSPFPLEAYFFNNKLYSEAEVAEKLRPIAQQIALDADLLDRDFERYAPILDRLSVAEYLDKHGDKITEPFIRVLLENTIRTEYGVEPELSSALQLIYNLATVEDDRVTVLGGSDEAYVVRGGSGKIIDSLEAAIPQQIQTNKRLIQIQAYGDGYRLIFRDRSVVDADYVIIAIPFSVLRNVTLKVELEPKFRKFIREVDLGKNEKVFAGFENRVWLQEEGFTENAWCDLGFSQVWVGTQRQPEQENSALTFFLGGKQVTSIESKSLSSLHQTFLERFQQIIPQAKSSATEKSFHTNWHSDPLNCIFS